MTQHYCKACGLAMRKSKGLPIWRCFRMNCAEFDRPYYEKRVTRKAVAAALKAIA